MVTDPASPPWRQLTEAIKRILPCELSAAVRTIPCDRDKDGRYTRNIGFECARDLLLAEHYQTGTHPALLLVGLFPLPAGGTGLAPAIRAMLSWSGVAYLPYGFSKEELIETGHRVIAGANTPFPKGFLPTVGDVLRLTAEIRHWLENRSRNTEGALSDFVSAGRGVIQLHRTHLTPVAAISKEHRAMLNRLWALEIPARQFAPRMGGISPLKTAVTEFENRWEDFEAARDRLRAGGPVSQKQCFDEAIAQFARVRDALQAAITKTRELDSEMRATNAN